MQWLAPNLVTAIGTLACVFHHIVVAFYATNLDEPLPWWLLVLGGLSVFFYNTMDSIDGKQARRTKASSPLGQLFDHGTHTRRCGGVAGYHRAMHASPRRSSHTCAAMQTQAAMASKPCASHCPSSRRWAWVRA